VYRLAGTRKINGRAHGGHGFLRSGTDPKVGVAEESEDPWLWPGVPWTWKVPGVLVSRRRNVAVEGHVHWRHAPAAVGVEVRGLSTRYAPAVGNLSAAHVNLAAGFEF
jgi:hypothetical protein